MKLTLLTLFGFVVIALSASAQATDSLFIVTYTTGPSWDVKKAPQEQPYFREHSARLGQLRKDGVIRFGARYGDKGMIVIAAATSSNAKEIVLNDQAVINKLFSADIQKLGIFYDGCLERKK